MSDNLEQTVHKVSHSLEETRELLYELIAYSTEQAKQNQEQQVRADRERAELRRQLGEMSLKMGTMVEDMVAPDLPRILRQVTGLSEEVLIVVNVRVRRLHPGQRENGKRQMVEIDAIAEGGDYVLLNETKMTLRSEHITQFLATLAEVRDYFPEIGDRQIIGAVSSLYLDASLVRYASRQGLLALAIGEGLMTLENEPGFQWRAF